MSSVLQDDPSLVRRFAETRDPEAFECLVHRYSGLVYNTAMRKGAAHVLAQEITQDVFVTFAGKARSLVRHQNIAGWIYGAAVLTANNALRKERRHREKMANFQAQATGTISERVPPELDGALASLRSVDREVILKHYYVGQSPREIAGASGTSEAAIRKRLSRSLKKLEAILKRRGVPVSIAALSASLAAELARSAPEGVAASVIKNTLEIVTVPVATTATGTTATLALLNSFAVSRHAGLIALFVGASIPVGISQLSSPATQVATQMNAAAGEPEMSLERQDAALHSSSPLALGQLIAEIRALADDAATADPLDLRARIVALQIKILDLPLAEVSRLASEIPDIGNASPLYPIVVSTFDRWAKHEPRAALAYALTRKERFYSSAALSSVFSSWARHDPRSAIETLTGYPDLIHTEEEHQLLAPTLLAIAENDPRKALDLLRAMEGGEVDTQAVSTARLAVLSSWANRSPDAPLAWIKSSPQSADGDDLMVEFIDFFGSRFPAQAVSLATKIERHQTREDGIMSVLQQWGPTDPVAAAAAYLELPDSVRTEHLTMNVVQFIASDASIALNVAEQLPPGYHRNAFITEAVKGKARSSPPEAATLAELLPDGWDRRNAAETVARAWIERDRGAALEWVKKNRLPHGKGAPKTAARQP